MPDMYAVRAGMLGAAAAGVAAGASAKVSAADALRLQSGVPPQQVRPAPLLDQAHHRLLSLDADMARVEERLVALMERLVPSEMRRYGAVQPAPVAGNAAPAMQPASHVERMAVVLSMLEDRRIRLSDAIDALETVA